MKLQNLLAVSLAMLLANPAFAPAQDLDKALAGLAEKLATAVQQNGRKKVTVLDFTDLNGNAVGELGKYIAEQATMEFVMMPQREFTVLDRANLQKILAEHKLTATGLVDPENAKKIGQFAGVDALILGTIITKSDTVTLNAKIITTDTAEIVGAARGDFRPDDNVRKLLGRAANATSTEVAVISQNDEKVKATKKFGNLRVDVKALTIVNGRDYLLTLDLVNESTKNGVWIAANSSAGELKAKITDPQGFDFKPNTSSLNGLKPSLIYQDYVRNTTAIHPGSSQEVTVKFSGREGRLATIGNCRLQLEFVTGGDPDSSYHERPQVLSINTKVDAF